MRLLSNGVLAFTHPDILCLLFSWFQPHSLGLSLLLHAPIRLHAVTSLMTIKQTGWKRRSNSLAEVQPEPNASSEISTSAEASFISLDSTAAPFVSKGNKRVNQMGKIGSVAHVAFKDIGLFSLFLFLPPCLSVEPGKSMDVGWYYYIRPLNQWNIKII